MFIVNKVGKKHFDRNLAKIPPCYVAEEVYTPQKDIAYFMNLHPNHGFIWDKEYFGGALSKRGVSHPLDGPWPMKMTTESNSLAQNSYYMVENRLNSAFKAHCKIWLLKPLSKNMINLEMAYSAKQQLQKVGGLTVFMTMSLWGLKRPA